MIIPEKLDCMYIKEVLMETLSYSLIEVYSWNSFAFKLGNCKRWTKTYPISRFSAIVTWRHTTNIINTNILLLLQPVSTTSIACLISICFINTLTCSFFPLTCYFNVSNVYNTYSSLIPTEQSLSCSKYIGLKYRSI